MKTIVTLEDELEINDFYKDLFEDFEFNVISATTYSEVMEIVKEQSVALLIVDNLLQYSNSEKDGLNTAREVRKVSPSTRIIMISSHYPRELEETHQEHGIDILLPKPFDISKLMNIVKTLTGIVDA